MPRQTGEPDPSRGESRVSKLACRPSDKRSTRLKIINDRCICAEAAKHSEILTCRALQALQESDLRMLHALHCGGCQQSKNIIIEFEKCCRVIWLAGHHKDSRISTVVLAAWRDATSAT